MYNKHQENFQVLLACSAQNPKMLPKKHSEDTNKKRLMKAYVEHNR